MTQEIEKVEQQLVPLSTEQVLTQRAQVLRIMKEIMKEGVHFGVIPGCKKPSLYQPGAEAMNTTFHLAWKHEILSETNTEQEIAFTVRSTVFSYSGVVMGDAIGTCSTSEDKYAWRKTFIEEWNAFPPELRRIKWQKPPYGSNVPSQISQVHTCPADMRNTVLAMASKRADVRATRAALAVSDIFDVNIEDLPEDIRQEIFGDDAQTTEAKGQAKTQANNMENRARAGVSQPEEKNYMRWWRVVKTIPELIAQNQEGKLMPSSEWFHRCQRHKLKKNYSEWTVTETDQALNIITAYVDEQKSKATPEPEPEPTPPDDSIDLDENGVPVTDPFANQ